MTDTNAKLAKAMGWKPASDAYPEVWKNASGDWVEMDTDDWCCESLDAFHTHVLPELKRRGLMEVWAEKVAELVDTAKNTVSGITELDDEEEAALFGITFTGVAACLSAPASVLCEAALAVMGGGE